MDINLGNMAVIILFRFLIYIMSVKCVGYCLSAVPPINSACKLQIIQTHEDYEYIQEGDIIIGGVITVNALARHDDSEEPGKFVYCYKPSLQNYKYLLDFLYLIGEFNKDEYVSQNLTLGYHISDSCGDVYKAEKSVLQILSGTREPVPNYSCAGKRNIVGFIGDLTSETTIPIAHILSVLGYSQLYHLLKKMIFPYEGQFLKSFNENGELVSPYHINNLFITNDYLSDKKIGLYIPWAPPNQKLNITHNEIIWKTESNKVPRAQCSDNCLPGFRKALKPGAQSCCYDCVLCSEGEISNRTDSENCFRCPDTEWPNANKNVCIVKGAEFLSYTNDVISVFFSSISVLLFVITLLILGIFIIYRDTPIVRANNRSLSFLLLVSIKLSFLSVFLFLGRPVDITCMLRIITFGITFSIAVSSLLAKTIMVCVAFKATKPGSSWRKWLGVKLSNSVVLFCSSIQIIICMTWLAISPPFQELDIHTSPGTIIIQCNEGSAIGFYSVIGYMGLLAAVSFVLAFLARSLPDSFNEAKYITFSMLLFCSVWITMIPAYLSTKGKNTVCVEIFAILTSSAGLQGCIFLPKCYTILFRPEINSKSFLRVNKFC
uniref:G-protein coupled receptors family 3 profile domain-containing protein n=1 Tax=Xenopus tropicalis TaxID=8364 RepID=A0A803JU81_XENTR